MGRPLTEADSLADFARQSITFLGESKLVFVAGEGPAVIVLPELPGIYSYVARFARFVCDAGFTVWMPNLFGEPGAPITIGRHCAYGQGVHQLGVPRLRLQRLEPRDRLAARARCACTPALRRARASGRSACASPATSPSR